MLICSLFPGTLSPHPLEFLPIKLFSRLSPLIFALFLASTPSLAVENLPEVLRLQEEVLSTSVQINDNCSGTIVKSSMEDGRAVTFVLTANHCTDGREKTYKVDVPSYNSENVLQGEYTYYADLDHISTSSDVAMLKLRDTETVFHHVASVAPEGVPLYQGEDVFTAGYSLGMDRTVTKGLLGPLVTMEFPAGQLRDYYRATADIAPGNSGGATYHKTAEGHYELIGLTTAGVPSKPFIGLYTPVAAIQEFFKTFYPSLYKTTDANP